MVQELVSKKYYTCKDLQFLLMKTDQTGSGLALDLKCDLLTLKTSKLFEKSDIDVTTLEAVMELGATIKLKGVERAVKHITDDKVPVLKYAVSACDPKLESEALNSLCEQALSLSKPNLSAFLMSEGAKPNNEIVMKAIDVKSPCNSLVSALLLTPDGCVCLLIQSINKSELALAERCLEGCTSIFSQVINLGDFLKSSRDLLCQNPSLLESLLKLGVSPNGLPDGSRPIDAVLELPKDFQNKARLICLLIENGVDLTKATYPRAHGTTIFHIAVEMAIDLRKYDNII